jgi:hypothetical protein
MLAGSVSLTAEGAQDWTGVSSPALLHALQSIMPATVGPGTPGDRQAETIAAGRGR